MADISPSPPATFFERTYRRPPYGLPVNMADPTMGSLNPGPMKPAGYQTQAMTTSAMATQPNLPAPYTAPTPQTFTGTLPTATPYGEFTAPDPSQLLNDPYTQFRLAEGQKGMERSAAARGTLLTGGLQKALERYRQGVASEEGQNIFNRALSAYTTNRDTNAQNFGQRQAIYGDQLSGFNANTNAADTYGRLGMGAYDRSVDAAKESAANTDAINAATLGNVNALNDAYEQQVAETRRQNDAAAARRPGAAVLNPLGRIPVPARFR